MQAHPFNHFALAFEEVLNGLFRWQSSVAGVHHPANSYIWKRPQGLVLIDPAADLTAAALNSLALGPVTDIYVTHLQEEHAAGCYNFPGARIHIPEGDEYLCRGYHAYESLISDWAPPWDWSGRGNFMGHIGGARNERPLNQPIELSSALQSGEEFDTFTVLSTPGQGKHAVTLLAETDGLRVAFCGDLIYGDGQLWNWFDCEWDYGQETGQRTLRDSAARLQYAAPQLLCPAHGPVVHEPGRALAKLGERIEAVLSEPVTCAPLNFPEQDSPAQGWRELLPNLHQWRTGNCAVLISATGNALLIDDGLCYWEPELARAAHHERVIKELKRSLGIARIEMVIVTHYHGDHIENIPDLVAMEPAQVVALDIVAEAVERPGDFDLACMLPWYGTAYDVVSVDKSVPDKTRLKWHEYELEIFHLAGQTYRHAGIATMVGDKRVLFAGDALPGWHPAAEPVMCYNDNEPQHRGWAYSLERMIERRPDLLVCGHGAAVRDPMLLLEAKRANWQKRMAGFKALSAREDLRLFFDPFFR